MQRPSPHAIDLDSLSSAAAFAQRFGDEQTCWDALVGWRWPQDRAPRHPETGERPVAFRANVRRWRFADGYEMSATVGTIMERSHVELPTWFAAAYAVATHPFGLSARHFARQRGLRYETAFQLLQRLRAGLVDPNRRPLHGIVDVAIVPLGGHRDPQQDAPVAVAVERLTDPDARIHPGRVRFRVLDQVGAQTMAGFLGDHVAARSTVVTDQAAIAADLASLGYAHRMVTWKLRDDQMSTRLGVVRHVIMQVERSLGQTYGSAVSRHHLQAYLNEMSFRISYRDVTQAFRAALGLAVDAPPPRYADIASVRMRRSGGWRHVNPRSRGGVVSQQRGNGKVAYPVGARAGRPVPGACTLGRQG